MWWRLAACQGTPGGVSTLEEPLTQSPGDSHPCACSLVPLGASGKGLPQPELQPWVPVEQPAGRGGRREEVREEKGKGEHPCLLPML